MSKSTFFPGGPVKNNCYVKEKHRFESAAQPCVSRRVVRKTTQITRRKALRLKVTASLTNYVLYFNGFFKQINSSNAVRSLPATIAFDKLVTAFAPNYCHSSQLAPRQSVQYKKLYVTSSFLSYVKA